MADEVLTLDSLGGLKVYSAGDIEKPERVLIYGPPGCGKTPFVASAHAVNAFHPLLVIDCDEGPKSIRRSFPSVRVVSPRTLAQLERVIEQLIGGRWKSFGSICLDGASTVQFRGYEHLYGKEGKYRSFTDFTTPGWGNHGYQASAQQMAIMVEMLKQLPVHVFVTAWAKNVAKVTKQNPDPPEQWEPSFTPAAADAIDGRFDSILYLGFMDQNGKSVKYLRTLSNGRIMARDRDGRLPEVIKEPSMELLAKHWGLDHSRVET